MKTHATPPNSSSRQTSLFTRLALAWRHGVSVLAAAHGATFLLILFSAALLTTESEAASIPVSNTNDRLTGSLRQAIQNANPQGGDTIIFQIPTSNPGYNAATGVFTVTLTEEELVISGNLTIDGGGQKIAVQRSTAANTPAFRIFEVTAGNVVLSGLTISNGDSTEISGGGGGIRISGGNLTVLNCTISNNHSGDKGGGIFNVAGTLTVNGGTFRANTATYGGGIFNRITATVSRSTFSGNTADDLGGGIYNLGPVLTLTSCTITGNTAAGGGGGVDNADVAGLSVTTHVRNTIIAGNSITGGGGRDVRGNFSSDGYNFIGGIDNYATGFGNAGSRDQVGTLAIPANPCLGPLQDNGGPTQTSAPLNGSFVIDQGDSGGLTTDQRGFPRVIDVPAIFNAGDGTDIGACEAQVVWDVNNNDDSGSGSLRAGIANVCPGGTITFAPNVRGVINLTSGELLVDRNLTISGPGAHLLSVQRSAAAGTQSFRIFHIGSNTVVASIAGLTIANGHTPTNANSIHGGGIANFGTLTVTNCVISDNNTGDRGGGIFNRKTLTISNSTISGNSATGGIGGGIHNETGTLNVTNSTISGNAVSGGEFGLSLGGGIASSGGMVTVTNSTISGNTARRGGAVSNNITGALRVRNTIIALNTAPTGPDVYGPVTSEGFNLIGDRADGGDVGAFEFGGAAGSLKILSITRSGNGPVVLQVAGIPHGVHRIQTSVDLSFGSFIDIATVTADSAGRFQFQSPVAGLTQFYRAAFP